jgi:hypothetical protein
VSSNSKMYIRDVTNPIVPRVKEPAEQDHLHRLT